MTQLWVGTSWKMNKSLAEARDYAHRLAQAAKTRRWPGVTPFIVPPATAISAVAETLGPDSPVELGAQNAHWEDSGAWTGEVSMSQVRDAGAQLVEIGHSERRTHFGETDRTVNLKIRAAQRHGLLSLLCVGEGLEDFHRGRSVSHVVSQTGAALAGLDRTDDVLIAYEPVWAIGEGGRPARPDDVAAVFAALADQYGAEVAGVIYGGSVNRDNAAELLDVRGNSGLFVGRAAWEVGGFLAILDTASHHLDHT